MMMKAVIKRFGTWVPGADCSVNYLEFEKHRETIAQFVKALNTILRYWFRKKVRFI